MLVFMSCEKVYSFRQISVLCELRRVACEVVFPMVYLDSIILHSMMIYFDWLVAVAFTCFFFYVRVDAKMFRNEMIKVFCIVFSRPAPTSLAQRVAVTYHLHFGQNGQSFNVLLR